MLRYSKGWSRPAEVVTQAIGSSLKKPKQPLQGSKEIEETNFCLLPSDQLIFCSQYLIDLHQSEAH